MRDRDQILAIERVGQNPAKKTEDNKWQRLKKTRQTKLHRRSRKLIHLIEARHIAHVVRRVAAENGDEDQTIVANQERRPGADGPRRLGLGWKIVLR